MPRDGAVTLSDLREPTLDSPLQAVRQAGTLQCRRAHQAIRRREADRATAELTEAERRGWRATTHAEHSPTVLVGHFHSRVPNGSLRNLPWHRPAYLPYPDLPGTPPSGVIPTIPGATILRQETGSTRHGSPLAACPFLALEAPMARRYLLYEEADSIGYCAFGKCTGKRDDLE
jgi:hypothetical protein